MFRFRGGFGSLRPEFVLLVGLRDFFFSDLGGGGGGGGRKKSLKMNS